MNKYSKMLVSSLLILACVIQIAILSRTLYHPIKWTLFATKSTDIKGRPCYELGDSLQLVFCKDDLGEEFDKFVLCKNGISVGKSSINTYRSMHTTKFGMFLFIDYQYLKYLENKDKKNKLDF